MTPVAVPCPRCVSSGRTPSIAAHVYRASDGELVAVTGLKGKLLLRHLDDSPPEADIARRLPAELAVLGPFRGAFWFGLTPTPGREVPLTCRSHRWVYVPVEELRTIAFKRAKGRLACRKPT